MNLKTRTNAVSVSWVKGHAKRIDIERGRTTELDKWGNDGADALAVRGAQSHRMSDSIVQSAKLRKLAVKSVQKMMIAVLKARFAAEQAHDTEAADRGSELGDFDTEPLDTEDLCTGLDDDFDLGSSIRM